MLWECNECGGLNRTVPRLSVCPLCGEPASPSLAPSSTTASELTDLREHWVQVGMAQSAPLFDFASAEL